jgi:hypothetical protein
MTAIDQTSECKAMPHLAMLIGVPAVEYPLGSLPKLT